MSSAERIHLLIVDNDDAFRGSVLRRLARRGFQAHEAADGSGALELATRQEFGVAIVALTMRGMGGLELLGRLKENDPACEVILLTSPGTSEAAVEAMKRGAYGYLTKPFSPGELEVLIHKACESHVLRKENRQLSAALERSEPKLEIVGKSPAMRELLRLIDRAGPNDKPILIHGVSGTGKELVARALHRVSRRAQKPFVMINCAALSDALLESELFGHEQGAFTGAHATKLGLLEVADGGTLLIEEVGELPGPLQARLLRVLEDGLLRRVGSSQEIPVDVRLLAATNRDLQKEVQAGRFREDLYYRINVMSLELPRLRDRAGDVRLLVDRFLDDDWEITPKAMAALERYPWPGNVRQLIDTLQRARILADDNTIDLIDLPGEIARARVAATALSIDGDAPPVAIERAHVIRVLERNQGNKARAARMLGVTRRGLYRLIEKFGLQESAYSPEPTASPTNGVPDSNRPAERETATWSPA